MPNDSEIRAWVEMQGQVLEERNVDALVEVGLLSGQQAKRVQQVFS